MGLKKGGNETWGKSGKPCHFIPADSVPELLRTGRGFNPITELCTFSQRCVKKMENNNIMIIRIT